jgi:hypothetical protein
MANRAGTISNPQLDVIAFAIAPIAALSVNAIERRWLGGSALGAFRPFMIVGVYTFAVLFGLPLHDYLLNRNTQWWVYMMGAGAVAALPFVLLVPDADTFLADTAWLEEFGRPVRQETERHGNLPVLRVWYQHGLEVEFGFADGAGRWMPVVRQ